MTAIIERERDAITRQAAPPPSGRSVIATLRWLGGHTTLLVAIVIVVLVLLWAVVPQLFTHYDPYAVAPAQKLRSPSGAHWFGTDQLGRDLYARVVYGARASLTGSVLAVAVAVVAGTLFGALAGWFGGFTDGLLMRVIDVVLSIPGFLLAITLVVLLGFGIWQAGIAVGLTASATFARLIRSTVIEARASTYVEAAITSGASTADILRRHVIPNSIAPTVSLITVQFGVSIVWIASLSFLGLGAQPPQPEWGRLVADGHNYIATRGWLTLWPALTVVAVVLAANHISHHVTKRSS